MARAIIAISGSAMAMLPRPFAGFGQSFAARWHELTHDLFNHYRPERHYMRGPGPAWQAKHGNRGRQG